jgi:hypothetical protein
MKILNCLAFSLFMVASLANAQPSLQKLYSVNFSQVSVTDAFWKGRMETVANSTISTCVLYTENKTGRIRNFEISNRVRQT